MRVDRAAEVLQDIEVPRPVFLDVARRVVGRPVVAETGVRNEVECLPGADVGKAALSQPGSNSPSHLSCMASFRWVKMEIPYTRANCSSAYGVGGSFRIASNDEPLAFSDIHRTASRSMSQPNRHGAGTSS